MKTSASPLPRPLLAHYPRKSSEDLHKHVNHGFPKGVRSQTSYSMRRRDRTSAGDLRCQGVSMLYNGVTNLGWCASVQVFVAPHFAQPNSIEFEPALRWRHLQRSLAHAKRQQREAHAADLAAVMRAYQKVGQHSKAHKGTSLLPSSMAPSHCTA